MPITFPLSLPSARGPSKVVIRSKDSVGLSMSPFDFSQEVFQHQGAMWEMDVDLPPLVARADAEEWTSFLMALQGMRGQFLMGDPAHPTPRGTWGGSPVVKGAGQKGMVLQIHGLPAGATGKKGDWFQLGSGLTTRLHKLILDFTANGAGEAELNFWPPIRETPADSDPLVYISAKGTWRLASNTREWSIDVARTHGIKFTAMEAL